MNGKKIQIPLLQKHFIRNSQCLRSWESTGRDWNAKMLNLVNGLAVAYLIFLMASLKADCARRKRGSPTLTYGAFRAKSCTCLFKHLSIRNNITKNVPEVVVRNPHKISSQCFSGCITVVVYLYAWVGWCRFLWLFLLTLCYCYTGRLRAFGPKLHRAYKLVMVCN